MAIPLDPKQVVSFEELLMSQVVQQKAITRLLVEKGIFTQDEFIEIVKKDLHDHESFEAYSGQKPGAFNQPRSGACR